ncbi:MAG TPA: helix-turn-helix domain-containing protein [Lachnospiraceae bacterium]|nr:helix-turn-helix domain-containing protein [Lachnospiraceae bacterium]
MTFREIVDRLSKDYNIELLSCPNTIDLQDVSLIDCRVNSPLKSTLYFGYDKQIKNLNSLPHHCILAKTSNTIIEQGKNIAFVPEESLFTVFNDVKMMLKTSAGKGIFEELTAIADQTHNIDAVIDAAAVHLQNALIFCDRDFKIITSSTTYPVTDAIWTDNAKQGYCSYEFINEVKELESIKNASFTTASFEVSCPLSPHRKLSSKVFHNQTQVGFLLMLEGEKQILPSHFEMLSIISHVISYTIAFYLPNLFEGKSPYHEVLYDMLIGAPSKDISARLKELTFPNEMLVLFIRSTRYIGPSYMRDSIGKLFKERLPGTHNTYIDKGIVALIPFTDNDKNVTDLNQVCKDLSESQHLRIGISNSFRNIEYFGNYYAQAHAAFELGQKLNPEQLICHYSNYQIFDLFSETKHPESLGRFCHPALAILRQNDLDCHSELYKTLCIYIENGCSIKHTSEALFIHRNSLVYRLNRIVELCHLDFTNTNTLFLLRLSFLIDRYNGFNTITEWK